MIRESKVKRWNQGKLIDVQAAKSETFYEVITDTNIIGRAKEKLSGKRAADEAGREATEPLF